MTEMYEVNTDEWGDEFYSKKICLELKFCSYDSKMMKKDIIESIFELINDCAFDDIGWFEKVEK